MEYLAGAVLGVLISAAAAFIGFDRDRAFYPTLLIVIASYYILFTVMSQSVGALLFEVLVAGGFLLAAVIGFRLSLWIVVVALVGHGIFDYVHHLFVENPGVPTWWPGFCLAVDVTLGAFLAVVLMTRAKPALQADGSCPPELARQVNNGL